MHGVFGKKLKNLRNERGITQEQLATMLGITHKTIWNYENKERIPSINMVEKICKVLDVDLNYFQTENEQFLSMMKKEYGAKGAKQAEAILANTTALLAGGELNEADEDAFKRSLMQIIVDSKEKAKEKYTPRKYRTPK